MFNKLQTIIYKGKLIILQGTLWDDRNYELSQMDNSHHGPIVRSTFLEIWNRNDDENS